MRLGIPDMALVVLIGASGSGKSTFAHRNFAATQVLSSDYFRGLVADDVNDQSASGDAFDALHYVAGKRLAAGRVTVVDATNVRPADRSSLVELARQHHVLPVAIVLDLPESLCVERNARRPDRPFGAHVVRRHRSELRKSLKALQREGFRRVHTLRSVEEVDAATVEMEPLFNDKRHEHGPFDVIGDVHGCRGELEDLLFELGYRCEHDADGQPVNATHPEGRRAVFVGDLVDRGPDTPGVLRLVMGMVAAGNALAVCGNHEQKLVRALRGKKVRITHGLGESLEQLAEQSAEFRERVTEFCDGLVAHYVLDGGRLVVAHAGLPEHYHGRASGAVRAFALYGQTTGDVDEHGRPVRLPWANDYRGKATVLYGHTPVSDAEWVNGTMCLDTGCVFGGKLTALRYPEREVVSVPAQGAWCEGAAPAPSMSGPSRGDEARPPGMLNLSDVAGRRIVSTERYGRIAVPPERAAAALEVMSRFAVDPRWLLYLPPTMAPTATTRRTDLLEHPEQAFAGYRSDGVRAVVCQEKHMGSRAVLLVCRDETTAADRFGIEGDGVIHTRTGRPFFAPGRNAELLARVRDAATSAGLWQECETDWLLLDAELMPWSAKAGTLITAQFASVGAAASAALPVALDALDAADRRGIDVSGPRADVAARVTNAESYRAAYRRYCWPTEGTDGLRLAPFQLLATEGRAYHDREHEWHLALADRLVRADPELFAPTRRRVVDTTDPESIASATRWWEELTAEGGEGMVVKPAENLAHGKRGRAQPGVKVRGREYLRIVYGPDYTEPRHLDRLRHRGVGRKRSLAGREYELGIEGLDRLARGEPLWRVHECVFAVLALESEPVDPRL